MTEELAPVFLTEKKGTEKKKKKTALWVATFHARTSSS